jgi:hypothetical protein
MKRLAAAVLLVLMPQVASAACINRFLQRRDAPGRWLITLLTGHMTFQEAQALAKDISERRAEPIEWVDDKGKTIAKQVSPLKVMRPMPSVACEGKASGVIMVTSFLAAKPPAVRMNVKFGANTTVPFDEQKE